MHVQTDEEGVCLHVLTEIMKPSGKSVADVGSLDKAANISHRLP